MAKEAVCWKADMGWQHWLLGPIGERRRTAAGSGCDRVTACVGRSSGWRGDGDDGLDRFKALRIFCPSLLLRSTGGVSI